MWTLRKIYRGQRGPPFSPDEGRLLAALPGVLGETALGNVEKVAMGAENVVVWRWSFEAAGYSIISDDFRSEGEAVAELRLLQRKLYPEWCEKEQRQGHLERWRHVLRERRQGAPLMEDPGMQGGASPGRSILPEVFVPGEAAPRMPFPG